MIKYYLRQYGGCGQVVKAVGCDSTIRRFNSGHSPHAKYLSVKSKKNQISILSVYYFYVTLSRAKITHY